jgi:signal peptidase
MRYLASRAITPGNLVALLLVALFLIWFVLLRPSFLGGAVSYIMVSGESMEPTLYNGDLAVARSEGSYRVGDLVAFRVPEGEHGNGGIVIHRIVSGSSADGFRTQGDNNEWADPWSVGEDDIVGERWVSVPGAGRWLHVLRAPVLLAGLVSGVGVFLVLIGGEEKKRPRKVSRTKRCARARSLRLPRGLALWLLLILAAVIVPSRVHTVRH